MKKLVVYLLVPLIVIFSFIGEWICIGFEWLCDCGDDAVLIVHKKWWARKYYNSNKNKPIK